MLSDSSSYSSDEVDQNPELNPNSIDQSLDAIENQLASISMSQPESLSPLQPEPRPGTEISPGIIEETASFDPGMTEETASFDQGDLMNGSLDEELTVQSDFVGMESSSRRLEEELKATSSREWRSVEEEEEEGEREPPSPSSSGYAGERGSSSSTSGIEGQFNDDKIGEIPSNGDFDGFLGSQAAWLPGKHTGGEVS